MEEDRASATGIQHKCQRLVIGTAQAEPSPRQNTQGCCLHHHQLRSGEVEEEGVVAVEEEEEGEEEEEEDDN